jgi:hypothetical protein
MQRKFDFSRGIFLFFSKSGPVHTRTTPAPGRGGCRSESRVSRLFRRFATQRIARTSSCFDSRSTSNTNIIALGDERAVGGDIICRDALILLDYFRLFVLYSRLFRQRDRERERDGPRKFFLFLFSFCLTGSGAHPLGPPLRGGGRAKRIAGASSIGTRSQDWDPLLWAVMP